MYKKCAQLVETYRQNPVQAYAQHPHNAAKNQNKTLTSQHIHSFTQYYAHGKTHNVHKLKSKIQSVKNSLCTLSPQPTITTTKYIKNRRTNKKEVL